MPFLDTHCHLDKYTDPVKVLTAARASDIDLVAVTESPDAFRRFRTRLGRAPGVAVALGLHPASSAASAPGQLQRFFRMLPDADWIGEIGLDYSSRVDTRARRSQYSTLASIVDHDLARTLPMTVHSRGAAADVVAILEGTGARAVLHWFTGTAKQASRGADAGLWFSANNEMAQSKGGGAVIAAVPPDRLLLETDGPYCQLRGRPAEPKDILEIVELIARALGIHPHEAAELIQANTSRFLAPADGEPSEVP